MVEYTWNDLIFNPTLDSAEQAIGKEVYYGDTPAFALHVAQNDGGYKGCLNKIRPDSDNPFEILTERGLVDYGCVIVKKEEPKPKHGSKYIPYQITTENLAEYWEKLKGRAFIIDDEECTLIETVTSIYKDFDAKEADINKYKVSLLYDEARWLDTGEPVGEEIEDE